MWITLPPGRGARDVRVVFNSRELHITIGDDAEGEAAAAAGAAVVLGGALKGKINPEDCYWVLEDESGGERAVQVVLAKAHSFTRWDGMPALVKLP